MSSLKIKDRRILEEFLGMTSGGKSTGYVLDFSNREFEEFVREIVDTDIYSDYYSEHGISKANRLRAFWELESDYTVGKLLGALIDHSETYEKKNSVNKCREIVSRLLTGGSNLTELKKQAESLGANHLGEQIRRMEESIEKDPGLAIGTAKELIETCCKMILADRGKEISKAPNIGTLTKMTLKELDLVPEGISDAAKGADVIKRLLGSLGTISQGLTELRGLYGTGHGKHGSSVGLSTRHAKLAVGAASTLAVFLFETHKEKE